MERLELERGRLWEICGVIDDREDVGYPEAGELRLVACSEEVCEV